jgi:hypothetical protein
MRFTVIFLVICAAGLAADDPLMPVFKRPEAKARKPKAKPVARPVPAPLVVPPEAKQTAPSTWLYVDPQGKRWTYRETPFGIVRYDEKIDLEREAAEATSNAGAAREITAVDDGDSVRFERQGPFGAWKWSKKKTEMDEIEKRAWERSRQKADAPEKAVSEKAARE